MIIKLKQENRLTGLLRVTSANFIVMILGMITSFLIPMAIPTNNYGYLQLFTLYSSYNGFFMLGFNDGIHLNYAGMDYNEKFILKFRTFRNVVLVLGILGTLIMLIFANFILDAEKQFIIVMVALSIVLVGINGFCAYVNQNTLRFKEYSRGIVIEKAIYVILTILLVSNVDDYRWYISASVFSSSIKLIYNLIVNNDVMFGKGIGFKSLRVEIKDNFIQGFVLMVSLILNSSISVGGRLIVESKFGIVSFGGFSFALNTMSIASLFILTISQVFFPLLKRVYNKSYETIISLIDNCVSYLSALLLISYFGVHILVMILYKNYSNILDYLIFLYPTFIFQCKFSLLLMNIYKVEKNMKNLIISNLLGIFLNLILSYSAYLIFNSVSSIAIATLICYIVWYYLCLAKHYIENNWKITISLFLDILYVAIFLLIFLISKNVFEISGYEGPLFSAFFYLLFLLAFTLLNRKNMLSEWRRIKDFLVEP